MPAGSSRPSNTAGARARLVIGALVDRTYCGRDRGLAPRSCRRDGRGVPTEAELATVDDAERLLDGAYRIFEDLAPLLTPENLSTPRTFSGRGRTAVLPPWAVLRQIVNHSTYHRGQVAAKLKRLGIEPPMTDLIRWVIDQMVAKSQAGG